MIRPFLMSSLKLLNGVAIKKIDIIIALLILPEQIRRPIYFQIQLLNIKCFIQCS